MSKLFGVYQNSYKLKSVILTFENMLDYQKIYAKISDCVYIAETHTTAKVWISQYVIHTPDFASRKDQTTICCVSAAAF